jgi:hypothetical protein
MRPLSRATSLRFPASAARRSHGPGESGPGLARCARSTNLWDRTADAAGRPVAPPAKTRYGRPFTVSPGGATRSRFIGSVSVRPSRESPTDSPGRAGRPRRTTLLRRSAAPVGSGHDIHWFRLRQAAEAAGPARPPRPARRIYGAVSVDAHRNYRTTVPSGSLTTGDHMSHAGTESGAVASPARALIGNSRGAQDSRGAAGGAGCRSGRHGAEGPHLGDGWSAGAAGAVPRDRIRCSAPRAPSGISDQGG